MATSTTSTCPLTDFYHTAPHVLTEILRHCSPTTFDALRYTCKAFYSMSLDPQLLYHHLETIINRQHHLITSSPSPESISWRAPNFDSKLDTLEKTKGNLWRLRGVLLQEFLRMNSQWRLGDYRKVVIDLSQAWKGRGNIDPEDPLFNGDLQISLGTVRSEAFVFHWSDRRATRVRTYRFAGANSKIPIRRMQNPDKLDISHSFSPAENKYEFSKFSVAGIGARKKHIDIKLDPDFRIDIHEGQYKSHPGFDSRHHWAGQSWRYIGWGGPKKEPTVALLRFKFNERQSDTYTYKIDTNPEVEFAFEMNWENKDRWKTPPITLAHTTPTIVLPDHSEEDMKFVLTKDGRCTAKQYAIGLEDRNTKDRWDWKIEEPRRLEQDVSRMGVWKKINVTYSTNPVTGGSLNLNGYISKGLVNPESTKKRFLLTSSKTMTPDDWAKIQINLVLPPTTHGQKHGKLLLAVPAPAAYFRRLGMRDPEIEWEDQGFEDSYQIKADPGLQEILGIMAPETRQRIRTGVMLHEDMFDAEIVSRIVGWTDDGAVWVWDVSEKHILDCGAQAVPVEGEEMVLGITERPARKLGYVQDVKGMAVIGDRLVQRAVLFTYGKELSIHRGGVKRDEADGYDSGISSLRQEDIMKGIERSMQKMKMEGKEVTPEPEYRDNETGSVKERKIGPGGPVEKDRWRMITFSSGEDMGHSAGFTMDRDGGLEQWW